MEGCRAAAGWSENARMYYILIISWHPGARSPLSCHPVAFFSLSSWGPGPARQVAWVDADPRIQVICITSYFFKICVALRQVNWLDCFATLAMTRDGISCHREGATRPWRSSKCDMGRCATTSMTWILGSSHGMTMWRKTRPRMTKRIQSTKNPHMIIFALQDMWQTNKINIKHVPNLNGGLLPAWGDECFVKYYQLSLQCLCFYQTLRTAQKW